MKNEIRVEKKNEAILNVYTSNAEINKELIGRYARRPEGYMFVPSYKTGFWNGYIYTFKNNTLPIGLLSDLEDFSKSKGYNLVKDFDDVINLNKEELIGFIDALDMPKKFEYRDYQIDATLDCINKKRLSVKINTAGGKSLIIYWLSRFHHINNRKIIIVVNSTNLVEQLYKDFFDYGWKNIGVYVSKIYGKTNQKYDKPITIITWQSLIRATKELNKFDVLIVDEAHGNKAKSLQTISKKSINASYRYGFSGTYQNINSSDGLTSIASLGPVIQYTNYKMLNKAGYVSNLTINNLILNYPQEICKDNYMNNHKDYQGEIAFIEKLQSRIDFIVKLANKLNGNTIVLFQRLDYGKELKSRLENEKKVFYIAGETKTKDRELIRKRIENGNSLVILASYGVFAQGVNIKRVHNIIMASNYKSLIKVIQSIGRSIRTHDSKETANIYNIVDNLAYSAVDDLAFSTETYKNYSLKHHKERLKLYEDEGFENVRETNILLSK